MDYSCWACKYIYWTSHNNTALLVKQLFPQTCFAQPFLLWLRWAAATVQTHPTGEKTVCTSFKLNSAWLRASLVGRSSTLNDHDCGLISVCVVSRWLQQQFLWAGGGGGGEKNLAVEYGGMGISKDQQVVRVMVTTPSLQSQNRNSHIPRSFMHVHAGKHEVTLPWSPLYVSSMWCFEVWDQTFWLIYDIWRASCRGTADSQWHDTSSVAWGGGGWVESPSLLKGLFFLFASKFFLCYDWKFRVLSVERDEWIWIIISVLLWFYSFFIFHRVPPHTQPPPSSSHRHLPPDVLISPPC